MLKLYIIIFTAIFSLMLPKYAQAKVNIFACEPEWKSLSEEIGREHVNSFSATTAVQDPHYIRARPSLIAQIRKSDLLICSGADLESSWLPILLTKANKNIQKGKTGYLMSADFVPTIDKPKILDRSMGDIHPHGNPHIHLNPYNILLVARELKNRLAIIDPINSLNYQKNYDEFVLKWDASILKWEAKTTNFKNKKFVTYHKSFAYLMSWLNISDTITLETKPGITPTVSHLNRVMLNLRRNPANLIIRTPYDPKDATDWISKKTKTKSIILPFTIGGNKESYDLFSLYNNTINLMLDES